MQISTGGENLHIISPKSQFINIKDFRKMIEDKN